MVYDLIQTVSGQGHFHIKIVQQLKYLEVTNSGKIYVLVHLVGIHEVICKVILSKNCCKNKLLKSPVI